MPLRPVVNDHYRPLVSILIINYNYGRFLRQCLDSVLAQTYSNIEICLSDNASTDNSWDIAVDYAHRHPGVMNLACNRGNFGADANFANCRTQARGKYMVVLCSDDALAPTFVETCVAALEEHDSCGYALAHRAILSDDGTLTEEPPFYSCSCVVPGAEQAAVYMMAAMNPSVSQVMYNTLRTVGKTYIGEFVARWYGHRLLDFKLCAEFDMAYVAEPLLLHRIHGSNDSGRAAENLIEVVGPYVLQHQLADIAANRGLAKAAGRLPEALDKLGSLALRYCVRALKAGDTKNARRYFHLAPAISPSLEEDPVFLQLEAYWRGGEIRRAEVLSRLAGTAGLVSRTQSYAPPEGSTQIDLNALRSSRRKP